MNALVSLHHFLVGNTLTGKEKQFISLEGLSNPYCRAYLLVSSLLFLDYSINSLALLISSLSFDLGKQHLISSSLLSTRSGVLLTC